MFIVSLLQIISEGEHSLGFATDSPWKDFTFHTGKGGLVVETSTQKNGRKKIYRVSAVIFIAT